MHTRMLVCQADCFYEDWTGTDPKRAEQLLMQDAALESLGIIALYKGETVTEE